MSLALGVLGLLFVFDPARSAVYPTCLFHRVTGLNCPGCGGLRSLHQLLHGHVVAAFRLNALVVLGLPVAAWFGLPRLWSWATGRSSRPITLRPGWLWLGLAAIVAFGLLRNLPFPAFAWMSP